MSGVAIEDDPRFTPEARSHMMRTPEGTVYYEYAPAAPVADPAALDEARCRVLHMVRVLALMSGGLLITALFAWIFTHKESAQDNIAGSARFTWNQILFIAEIAMVPFIAGKLPKLPWRLAVALYVCYAILNGLTFPGFFFWLPGAEVARLFAGCGLAYGLAALICWKRSIEPSGFVPFLWCMAVAVGSAVVVSIGLPYLAWSSSIVTIPLLLALTFYYEQEVRMSYQAFEDDDRGWKASLASAFFLYFAFVNLILATQVAIARLFARSESES